MTGNGGQEPPAEGHKGFQPSRETPRMSGVDLTSERYEAHREAGEILATARAEAVEMLDVGVGHLELAEATEARIRELGGTPAFPVNISVDEEAAHGTPAPDAEATFGEELVNLDIGVHIDGWLADSAITVDLRGEHEELVAASEAALEAAIETVEAGVRAGTVGAAIEEAIDAYGLTPVLNLSGHGLGHWEQHTEPNIPNRGIDGGAMLDAGDVVAIEPFATTGTGKVRDGNVQQIYALQEERSVRNRDARQVVEQITDEFRTLPFAVRWLDHPRAEMALRRLEMQDVVTGYPILQEDEGTYISQAEHTVIVTEDGCEVTTR